VTKHYCSIVRALRTLTPKAQYPNIMMMKFTTSIRNISAYTSHTGLYSGWMMS